MRYSSAASFQLPCPGDPGRFLGQEHCLLLGSLDLVKVAAARQLARSLERALVQARLLERYYEGQDPLMMEDM
jgi:hypothetical protein